MAVTGMKEISFAQKLADVENSVRMHALHKLQKFINYKSSIEAFTLEDLMKIWKGLYYCMYMADMPLVQEALADDIAKLIEEFKNRSQVFLFIEAAFETFVREWDGIDKFRMDKFMMLFTRFFRLSLIFLRQNRWNMEEVGKLVKLMETIIICPSDHTNSKPLGLKMHLTDIVLDELAKIGTEIIPNEVTITFLYPFFKVLVVSKQNRFIKYVETKIFEALVRVSDLGLRNHDDLLLEELEAAKEDEDDEEGKEMIKKEEPLDPRAGGIDACIPQLKPNYAQIADIFTSLGGLEEINQCKRNLLYKYVNIFLDLEMGVYPFAKLETSEQTANNSIVNTEEVDGNVNESVKKSAEVKNVKKLKLGDNGSVIKKNWKRLQRKTPEEKQKELKKANLNCEVAVNKVLLNLAVRNKIPNNFYISSNSTQNIETKNDKKKKKKKVQNPKSDDNGSLKLALLNEEVDKSPVKRKKRKIYKKSDINNASKENKTHFAVDVPKTQNKLATKIKMVSGKSQETNLMGEQKANFERKIVKQSESNDSVKLASLNIKLEKSPVEKRRKRKSKSGKNLRIDNVAVESTKQSTLNTNEIQNIKPNKINVDCNNSYEMMSNKDNLIGNKKGKFEKIVNRPEVNGTLKLSSLNDKGEKSPVKRKKRKIDKKSDINNASKENKIHFADDVQKTQNKLATKIKMVSEKSQETNLMGDQQPNFERKIVKQSESNDSVKLASVNIKLEKSPVEKRRKRKRKSGKNLGIDNVAVENTKQSTLNTNETQNIEPNRTNGVCNNSYEMMSNKDNLIGNKKGKFEKIVNPPEVNGTLKLSSTNDKGEKSPVGKIRKRKPKSRKISEIYNTANENTKQCANNIPKPQNKEVDKIKRCSGELPSKTNVIGNKKGKFEMKTKTLSDANKDASCKSSLTLGSINGKVKKLSAKKKKKKNSLKLGSINGKEKKFSAKKKKKIKWCS